MPRKLLYAGDFALVSALLECLKEKLETWKDKLESTGLRVNVKKKKIKRLEKKRSYLVEFAAKVSSNSFLCQFFKCIQDEYKF